VRPSAPPLQEVPLVQGLVMLHRPMALPAARLLAWVACGRRS
jgi:hypothetical protein